MRVWAAFSVLSGFIFNLTIAKGNRCIVYTYYDDLTFGKELAEDDPLFRHRSDQFQILRFWLRNWYANGWDPRIINVYDAQNHHRFEWYKSITSQFPTVNPKDYELSCYLRWLAFYVKGGGVFTDYDVMNFSASNIPPDDGQCGFEGGKLISFESNTPSIVFGNREAVKKIVNYLGSYKISNYDAVIAPHGIFPHTSDMNILRNAGTKLFDTILPTPPGVLHFSLWNAPAYKPMDRCDWIYYTLWVHFVRENRIRFLSLDKTMHSSLRPFLRPLSACPEDQSEADKIMHSAARSKPGDRFMCSLDMVDDLEYLLEKDRVFDIVFFEPVLERVLKAYAASPILRQFGDHPHEVTKYAEREDRRNLMVKRLGRCTQVDDIAECIDRAKEELRSPRVFVGVMTRLAESKLLLEYQIGWALPELDEAYVPLINKHGLRLAESTKKAILELNWADQELYEFASALFEERLEPVKAVEYQVEVLLARDIPYESQRPM